MNKFVMLLLVLFSLASATNRYVATTGDNSNDGTIGSPWLTVAHGCSTVVAGDTLFIYGGIYYEDNITPRYSGVGVSRIVYSGYQNEEAVIYGGGSNPIFQFGVSRADSNITIRKLTLRKGYYAGISLTNGPYSVNNFIIDNCYIDSTIAHDNTGGVIIGTKAGNAIIKNCTVRGDNTNNGNYAGIFIHSENGDILVSGCEVSYATMGIFYKYPSKHLYTGIIKGNYVHHCLQTGIVVNSDSVVVKNNIVSNSVGGILFWVDPGSRGGSNGRIEHNTIYNCRYPLSLDDAGGLSTYEPYVEGSSNNTVVNNLLYLTGYGDSYFTMWSGYTGDSTHKNVSDYNIYYKLLNSTIFYEYTSTYTFAQWRSLYPAQDANSIIIEPSFTNASGMMNVVTDFKLTSGSVGYLGGSDGVDIGANTDSVLYNPEEITYEDTTGLAKRRTRIVSANGRYITIIVEFKATNQKYASYEVYNKLGQLIDSTGFKASGTIDTIVITGSIINGSDSTRTRR